MMPTQPILLALVCCAFSSSVVEEQCDSFAAVQDHVQVHRPHSSHLPPNPNKLRHEREADKLRREREADKLRREREADKPRREHEPDQKPALTEFVLLRVIDRMIADVLGSSGTASLQKHVNARGGYAHKVKMEWEALEVDRNTSVAFRGVEGCEESTKGTQVCEVDLANMTNRPRVELRLGQTANVFTRFKSTVDVNMFFLHQRLHVSCAVCGQSCFVSFLGQNYTAPRPTACPIWAGRKWLLELPFDGLMMVNLTNVPFDGSVVVKTKLLRNDSKNLLTFTTSLLF